ncbi:hypothetical protein BJY04DRAFT_179794 [Aspergillus karnatakaensis]|uniref:uncharacterized protein n=1 Tax=Aspergillus karnatakaensis TaxID=1810916 RepID=UPI003CCE0A11
MRGERRKKRKKREEREEVVQEGRKMGRKMALAPQDRFPLNFRPFFPNPPRLSCANCLGRLGTTLRRYQRTGVSEYRCIMVSIIPTFLPCWVSRVPSGWGEDH